MARPVYRVPGYPTDHARWFIDSLTLSDDWKHYWLLYMPQFESACILSDFDEAVEIFPFVVEEKYLEGLEKIYKYNRRVASAELGEVLIEKSCGDKNISAIQTLIEAMIKGADVTGKGEKLIINLAK